MRREVVLVSFVMGSLLVGLIVFARSSYLDAYDTGAGQLVLAALLSAYGGLLVWTRSLVRPERPARLLSLTTVTSAR